MTNPNEINVVGNSQMNATQVAQSPEAQPSVLPDASPAIVQDLLKSTGINNLDDFQTIIKQEVKANWEKLFTTTEGINSLAGAAKQYYNNVNAPFNMFAEAENLLNQDSETSLEEKEIVLKRLKDTYKEIADDVSLSEIKRKELLTNLSKKVLDSYKTSKKETLFNDTRNYHELVGRLSEDHSPVMAQSLIAASKALFNDIFDEVPEFVDEMCKYMPPSIMKRAYDNLHKKHFAMDVDSMRMKYEYQEASQIMGDIMSKKLKPRR